MEQQAVIANGVGPVPHHVEKEVLKAKKAVAKKNQKPVVKASATIIPPAPKRRGRAPGSKNKPKAPVAAAPRPEENNIVELLPTKAMGEVIEVLEHGAQKYKGREWKVRQNDHLAKAISHIAAAMNGVGWDPETGRNPLAHAGARLLLALQIELEKPKPSE